MSIDLRDRPSPFLRSRILAMPLNLRVASVVLIVHEHPESLMLVIGVDLARPINAGPMRCWHRWLLLGGMRHCCCWHCCTVHMSCRLAEHLLTVLLVVDACLFMNRNGCCNPLIQYNIQVYTVTTRRMPASSSRSLSSWESTMHQKCSLPDALRDLAAPHQPSRLQLTRDSVTKQLMRLEACLMHLRCFL